MVSLTCRAFLFEGFRRDVAVAEGSQDFDRGILGEVELVPAGSLGGSFGFGVEGDAEFAGEENGHEGQLSLPSSRQVRLCNGPMYSSCEARTAEIRLCSSIAGSGTGTEKKSFVVIPVNAVCVATAMTLFRVGPPPRT